MFLKKNKPAEPDLPSRARRTRVAIVQPILSAVPIDVFNHIADHEDLHVRVFVLLGSAPERPLGSVVGSCKFEVEYVRSYRTSTRYDALGDWRSHSGHILSFSLPLRVYSWRPDVVICSNVTEYVLLAPVRALLKCPVGITVADIVPFVSELPSIKRYMREWIYKRADFFLPYGISASSYLRQVGIQERRITNANWSVNMKRYVSRSERPPDQGPYRWLTVGNLIPRKGHSELVSAWAAQTCGFRLQNQLHIVGDGPMYPCLRRAIESNDLSDSVVLHGRKTPCELVSYYASADCFVFPTLFDVWGLVVNEAIASGLPILCSTHAGCSADLVTKDNGELFDARSQGDIVEALDRFWRRRGEWSAMGGVSRRIAASYTVSETATRMREAVTAAMDRDL